MTGLLIDKKELLLSGRITQLEYYITESVNGTSVAYGIGIRLLADAVSDSKEIAALSFDRGRVMQLIDLMFRNDVTPVTAEDVVYDFMLI